MSAAHYTIRDAIPADASAIADIYNHYVRTSTATFDTEPKSVADREAWLAEHGGLYPVLVAEQHGRVVAWGSLSHFRERPAWGHTVEISSYVAPDATGQGIGPALLGELVERARSAGHHVIVSQIVAENEVSLKVSERAGFERVGYLREVGRKFDRWLDVVIMARVLD